MNKTLLLAGVAACLFAANANAIELKQYMSAKLTYSDMSNDVNVSSDNFSFKSDADDKVWGGSIAYGIKAGAVRTELELNMHDKAEKYQDENDWTASLENNSIMLNAYYDIDTGTKFTPYVGAGIGMAHLKAKVDFMDGDVPGKSKTTFAWQAGAGVSYAMTDNLALDLGYRYNDYGDVTPEIEEGVNAKFDSTSHEFLFGVRYTF